MSWDLVAKVVNNYVMGWPNIISLRPRLVCGMNISLRNGIVIITIKENGIVIHIL
jgi:hypothetical protein